MATIDLDDLPPKVAAVLSGLGEGEELVLVQAGAVVARLDVRSKVSPASDAALSELPLEERMTEVLEQFNAMIHDEF